MSWTRQTLPSSRPPLSCEKLAHPAGPPLALLHGVTRHGRDWAPLVPALAASWQPHLLDFRGHGQSGRADGAYAVVDYLADAVQLVRAIGRPLVVLGHSLGAMIAAAVAAQVPDLVRGVVLEDPPFETLGREIRKTSFHSQFSQTRELLDRTWPTADALAHALAELCIADPTTRQTFRLGDVRDPASLRFLASCLLQVDPAVLDPLVSGRWLAGFDWPELVTQITCPVLLLRGDVRAGGMLSDTDSDCLTRRAKHLISVSFPGVGHQIHQTDPAGMMRLVHPFLESLRSDVTSKSTLP